MTAYRWAMERGIKPRDDPRVPSAVSGPCIVYVLPEPVYKYIQGCVRKSLNCSREVKGRTKTQSILIGLALCKSISIETIASMVLMHTEIICAGIGCCSSSDDINQNTLTDNPCARCKHRSVGQVWHAHLAVCEHAHAIAVSHRAHERSALLKHLLLSRYRGKHPAHMDTSHHNA